MFRKVDKNLNVGLVLAGGSGKRMGAKVEKQLLFIDGTPIICKSLEVFFSCEDVDKVALVCPKGKKELYTELVSSYFDKNEVLDRKLLCVVEGGSTRAESSLVGLEAIKEVCGDQDVAVLIHDGARPYVTEDIIKRCIYKTWECGSAIPCVKVKDTIRTDKETLPRENLYSVQTPQTFMLSDILESLNSAIKKGFELTDDASAMEIMEKKVFLVEGSYKNIKITTEEDLPKMIRVGKGYDVHRVEEGLDCVLGGVFIENSKGMVAHSDGDVLTHAIMDSLLGAAALGDIGRHFPDSDEAYRGISSIELLKHVGSLIREKGWEIVNIDATVICEKPKISPHVNRMIENISEALCIPQNSVNIKGTTTEKLGFTGREEGIASESVCLIQSAKPQS